MKTPECPHPVIEKYVTPHGLVCEDCLTDADFKRYPGWRESLQRRKRKSAQAQLNFCRKSAGEKLDI
jgi:hypothetical protein